MDANLQQFLDEMKNSEETQKKYKDLIEAIMVKDEDLTDSEIMVKAASELGYDITCAQIERYMAETEEVDVEALERVTGGAETDDCYFDYSCDMAFLHPDTGEKNKACFSDYYCNAIYHKNPDIKVCE